MSNVTKVAYAVKRVRKAIAGAAATALTLILRNNGIELDETVIQTLLEAAFVSGIVYFVPNAKPIVEDEDI